MGLVTPGMLILLWRWALQVFCRKNLNIAPETQPSKTELRAEQSPNFPMVADNTHTARTSPVSGLLKGPARHELPIQSNLEKPDRENDKVYARRVPSPPLARSEART